jgi:hypothetical protein
MYNLIPCKPFHLFSLLILLCLPSVVTAQSEAPARYQIYGGYTFLSDSFNGVPGARQPLNGWDASLAFPPWRNVRFKLDTYAYSGTNLGAPQNAVFIMAGAQYGRRLGRETVFAEALMGDAGLSSDWGPNKTSSEAPAFAALTGGGIDTPLTRHFAYRVNGGFQYAYTALKGPAPLYTPYRIPGLPTYFGRISTGFVWEF